MVGSSWALALTGCVLALLAGCASATTRRAVQDLTAEERERLVVRPEHAPLGRNCWVSMEPAPSFAELVDSAAIHADLIRRWPDPDDAVEPLPAGQAILTMRVDSVGDVTWIDVHSSSLADAAVAFVSGLFPEHVKPLTTDGDEGPRDSSWTFRIVLDIGGTPAFTVARPVYCTPRLRNEEQVRAKLNALINLHGLEISGPQQSTLLWIMPGEGGKPKRIQVTRSSGNPALDQVAQRAALDALFDPAIADGHPLEVWVSIPINFTPPPRRRER